MTTIRNESMDSRNESTFLRISYTNPASLVNSFSNFVLKFFLMERVACDWFACKISNRRKKMQICFSTFLIETLSSIEKAFRLINKFLFQRHVQYNFANLHRRGKIVLFETDINFRSFEFKSYFNFCKRARKNGDEAIKTCRNFFW